MGARPLPVQGEDDVSSAVARRFSAFVRGIPGTDLGILGVGMAVERGQVRVAHTIHLLPPPGVTELVSVAKSYPVSPTGLVKFDSRFDWVETLAAFATEPEPVNVFVFLATRIDDELMVSVSGLRVPGSGIDVVEAEQFPSWAMSATVP